MAYNFRPCDRNQMFLLPPDMRDWIAPDHVAWGLIDVVGLMDLRAFDAYYRNDGSGAAAYDPRMMLTLLLYAFWCGEQSSRRIEQACRQDIAYRVICAGEIPDHTTISRFRQRFEREIEGLLVESVRLADRAGLVKLDVVAIDGRKLACDASLGANRNAEWIEREVQQWLETTARADAREESLLGAQAGDQLPVELADPNSRPGRLARAKAQLEAERTDGYAEKMRRREAYIAEHGKNPPGRPPLPPKAAPDRKANTTDPESRPMKSRKGFVQGYNGQVAVSADQIVLAAAVVQDATDTHQLTPTLDALRHNLITAGITRPVQAVVVDGGYGTEAELQALEDDRNCPELYVAITSGNKDATADRKRAPVADPDSARGRMFAKLRTDEGKAIYARRSHTVEGVFGHQETGFRFDRYSRRGQGAAQAEWNMSALLHNALNIIRHGKLDQLLQPA